MTDVYQELRDRTALGERIDAEVLHLDATAAPAGSRKRADHSTMQADANADPLARCAFLLLDLVDQNGEVTLDVVHWSGVNGCTVSMGAGAGDGGEPQCLIKEPERLHDPRRKSGFEW